MRIHDHPQRVAGERRGPRDRRGDPRVRFEQEVHERRLGRRRLPQVLDRGAEVPPGVEREPLAAARRRGRGQGPPAEVGQRRQRPVRRDPGQETLVAGQRDQRFGLAVEDHHDAVRRLGPFDEDDRLGPCAGRPGRELDRPAAGRPDLGLAPGRSAEPEDDVFRDLGRGEADDQRGDGDHQRRASGPERRPDEAGDGQPLERLHGQLEVKVVEGADRPVQERAGQRGEHRRGPPPAAGRGVEPGERRGGDREDDDRGLTGRQRRDPAEPVAGRRGEPGAVADRTEATEEVGDQALPGQRGERQGERQRGGHAPAERRPDRLRVRLPRRPRRTVEREQQAGDDQHDLRAERQGGADRQARGDPPREAREQVEREERRRRQERRVPVPLPRDVEVLRQVIGQERVEPEEAGQGVAEPPPAPEEQQPAEREHRGRVGRVKGDRVPPPEPGLQGPEQVNLAGELRREDVAVGEPPLPPRPREQGEVVVVGEPGPRQVNGEPPGEQEGAPGGQQGRRQPEAGDAVGRGRLGRRRGGLAGFRHGGLWPVEFGRSGVEPGPA